ncbi:MAG TPA: hypothetical protein VGO90_04400, partial [Chthoniobacteraceae bacterium]|nr:hypothetical protein [Chthoniobacteraceae bacterium]
DNALNHGRYPGAIGAVVTPPRARLNNHSSSARVPPGSSSSISTSGPTLRNVAIKVIEAAGFIAALRRRT